MDAKDTGLSHEQKRKRDASSSSSRRRRTSFTVTLPSRKRQVLHRRRYVSTNHSASDPTRKPARGNDDGNEEVVRFSREDGKEDGAEDDSENDPMEPCDAIPAADTTDEEKKKEGQEEEEEEEEEYGDPMPGDPDYFAYDLLTQPTHILRVGTTRRALIGTEREYSIKGMASGMSALFKANPAATSDCLTRDGEQVGDAATAFVALRNLVIYRTGTLFRLHRDSRAVLDADLPGKTFSDITVNRPEGETPTTSV